MQQAVRRMGRSQIEIAKIAAPPLKHPLPKKCRQLRRLLLFKIHSYYKYLVYGQNNFTFLEFKARYFKELRDPQQRIEAFSLFFNIDYFV